MRIGIDSQFLNLPCPGPALTIAHLISGERIMLKAFLNKWLFRPSASSERPKDSCQLNDLNPPKDFFSQVLKENLWGGVSSRSGRGSEGTFAERKIALIKEIATDYKVTTLLDLGCGDFFWMKEAVRSIDHYHGIDIVEELIDVNSKQFGGDRVSFQCLDLINPDQQKLLTVRKADLVLCLDVIGHLLNDEVDSLLRFILYDLDVRLFLVTNRREPGSTDYLRRDKTRSEGIDIEKHPLFVQRRPRRVKQHPSLYSNDLFDLYDLASS
jgi:hypothetical protein